MAERVVLESADLDALHDITVLRGLMIAGRVPRADGGAAAGVSILAAYTRSSGNAAARSWADGAFLLGPLAPGAWNLYAVDGGGAPSPTVGVEAGSEGVALVIGARGEFSVHVTDESQAPVQLATGAVIAADGKGELLSSPTDVRGLVDLRSLATGVYNASAVTADGRFAAERDVVLVAGGSVAVELVVVAAGRAPLRFEGPADSAFVLVHDRGLVVQSSVVARGTTLDITGPVGTVEVQVHCGCATHTQSVFLPRELGPELVFDRNWR